VSDTPDGLPMRAFSTAAAWESWLEQHGDAPGLWMKIAKKAAPVTSIDYAAALDVALCHGWIDGQKRSLDAHWFLQRFTPRRPRSLWSKRNIEHVARLAADGRMRAAGLAQVESAKADGRWDAAYDAASTMQVPPELAAELAKNAAARKFFASLDATNRYAVCWRVQTAKREATRLARAAQLTAMLARGEKIHA